VAFSKTRYEVPAVPFVKIIVDCDATPYSLVERY